MKYALVISTLLTLAGCISDEIEHCKQFHTVVAYNYCMYQIASE